jgi:tRNA G10  N-methylase Trm11
MRYLKQQGIRSVYDVFVGSGTTLAVAEQFGLSSFGIDIDEAQCRKARVFRLPA